MKPSATPEFRKLVTALGPYLDDLVVVGGWAHRLMTEHQVASRPAFEPLMTLDADLAGPERLPVRGENLRQRLLQAGFREELRGEDRPPISEYHLGSDGSGLYVEFLVPQRGSGFRRDRTPDDTALLAGVSAQKLRFIDLLLHEPWNLTVDGEAEERRYSIRFANPACFIAQKLLVFEKRNRRKQAKDLLYIHDTILLFGDALEELAELWLRVATKVPREAEKVREQAEHMFASVTDVLRNAAITAAQSGRANPPTAEEIRSRCAFAIREIFTGR